MTLHKSIPLGSHHVPYNYLYVNNAARLAASGFVAADVGKFARVDADNSVWMLVETTPVWVAISPIAGGLVLDGYASDTTVSEHYKQHSQAILTVLSALDGYGTSGASETTMAEHYKQHSDAFDTIRKDLDGYASATTVTEHYNQHSGALESVLKDLDGYALAADLTGLNTTETEHHKQHSDAIDTIRKDLDGYASTATGADGYVAFYTGTATVAGDNDLYWDRANNRLGIHDVIPAAELSVNGAIALKEQETSPDQPTDYGLMYMRGDSKLYFQDDTGQEYILSSMDGYVSTQSGMADGYIAFYTGENFIAGDNDLFYDRVAGHLRLGTKGRLQFGDSASEPAIERREGTAGLDVMLADGSDFAALRSKSLVCTNDIFGRALRADGAQNIYWSGRSEMSSPIDGNILLTNDAADDFGLLQLGGTTSSFPALKRAAATLQVVKADDSGFSSLSILSLVASGGVQAGGAQEISWNGRSEMSSPVDGDIVFKNNAKDDFGALHLGGTSSEEPSIRKVGRDIHFRQADDNDYTSVAVNALDAYGDVILHNGSDSAGCVRSQCYGVREGEPPASRDGYSIIWAQNNEHSTLMVTDGYEGGHIHTLMPSHAEMFMITPSATTVTANVPAKMGGITGSGSVHGSFLVGSANRIIYTGALTVDVMIMCSLSMAVDTVNDTASLYIAHNGAVLPQSTIHRKLGGSNDKGAAAVQTIVTMATDDYIELWAEVDANADITIEHMNMIARTL